MLWPATFFVQGLGAMASMMQEMQRTAADGIDRLRSLADESFDPEGSHNLDRPREIPTMQDKNLSDDMVKLVQWTVLSVKSDAEKKILSGEKVTDINTTSEGFTVVVLSQPEVQQALEAAGLSGADAKYVRVYYSVLDRWPKVDPEYDKKKIEVLQEISDKIA